MKIYGKTLNIWRHWVTVNWKGKEREVQRISQKELAYREYDENGELIAEGSEDFSAGRLENIKDYCVWTWDGEKRNKGGYRWFEPKLNIKIDRKNRKAAMELMKKWFPTATLIEFRQQRQAEGRRQNRPNKTTKEDKKMAKRTWADEEMERLNKIGRDNWTVEDWESYTYIKNVNAEADYYNSLD